MSHQRTEYEWKTFPRLNPFIECRGCGGSPNMSVQFSTTIKQNPASIDRSWTGLIQCERCSRAEVFDVNLLSKQLGAP